MNCEWALCIIRYKCKIINNKSITNYLTIYLIIKILKILNLIIKIISTYLRFRINIIFLNSRV